MDHKQEPKVLYWRVLLVGVGTVFGTALIALSLLALKGGAKAIVPVALFALVSASVISILLWVPMLAVWVMVFASLRQGKGPVRQAATTATAICAAIGVGVVNIGVGVLTGGDFRFVISVLPMVPVPIMIAAGLAWFAFGHEETLEMR